MGDNLLMLTRQLCEGVFIPVDQQERKLFSLVVVGICLFFSHTTTSIEHKSAGDLFVLQQHQDEEQSVEAVEPERPAGLKRCPKKSEASPITVRLT